MRRFWDKVDKSGDCWEWTASKFPNGYGQFRCSEVSSLAHRAAYELTHGSIPDGMVICHSCDNPACVNPDHLFVGTNKDNQADMVEKGRSAAGSRNGMAKLCDVDVSLIRDISGVPQRVIAEWFGISQTQVSRIRNGLRWAR